MLKTEKLAVLVFVLILSGCASTSNLKIAPSFANKYPKIRKIAVMPADLRIYKLTAGGQSELMDEWNTAANKCVKTALQKYIGQRKNYQVTFVDKNTLENACKLVWISTKALYDSVSGSILLHAYPGIYAFAPKVASFEYTLGPDVQSIAKACDADTLLFISGFDYEATGGRVALGCWNVFMGAITGTTDYLTNPSFMSIALVDGESGDLIWFNCSPNSEYSFRNQGSVNSLVSLLTSDFPGRK